MITIQIQVFLFSLVCYGLRYPVCHKRNGSTVTWILKINFCKLSCKSCGELCNFPVRYYWMTQCQYCLKFSSFIYFLCTWYIDFYLLMCIFTVWWVERYCVWGVLAMGSPIFGYEASKHRTQFPWFIFEFIGYTKSSRT